MTLYFHVFCVKLTNRRVACSGMQQLVWPFVLLSNRRSMLSGTYQLHLSFVILPNEVHLFFRVQSKCTDPDSMYSHAKMSTSLTTAFELAFPTREIRFIDDFFSIFDELTKVL